MINEILGDKARELPDQIRTTSFKNADDADGITSTYDRASGSANTL